MTVPSDRRFERIQRVEAVSRWLLDHAYRKQGQVAVESGVSPHTVRKLMNGEPANNVSMATIAKLERYIALKTQPAIVTPSASAGN